MLKLNKSKSTSMWALIMLLALMGQLMSVGVHASMISSAMANSVGGSTAGSGTAGPESSSESHTTTGSSPCHGGSTVESHSQSTLSLVDSSGDPTSDCCDNGCTMTGCHATTAIVTELESPTFEPFTLVVSLSQPSVKAAPITSLLRPPITA